MRRLGSGAGCGVPRACLASTPREASGNRPAPLRGPALSGWTRTAKGGRNPAGVAPSGAHVLARKHGPEVLNPAVARPQAPRSAAMRLAPNPPQPRLPARRSPHVWRGELLTPRTPRAPRECESMSSFGCLTFEQDDVTRTALPDPQLSSAPLRAPRAATHRSAAHNNALHCIPLSASSDSDLDCLQIAARSFCTRPASTRWVSDQDPK
jgi:hypothetical protein